MQPILTINVNTKLCACFGNYANLGATPETARPIHHDQPCREGSPVLIPLGLDRWRSVTFTVRLGECECTTRPGPMLLPRTIGFVEEAHEAGCPGTPVRVSCSIGGKTWEESEATDAWPDRDDGYLCSTGEEFPTLLPVCRERWALVKALVLGKHAEPAESEPVRSLMAQRDAVFSALAKLVRKEAEAFDAQEGAIRSIGEVTFLPDNFHRAEPRSRPSASVLARYVERMIEQVGVLP